MRRGSGKRIRRTGPDLETSPAERAWAAKSGPRSRREVSRVRAAPAAPAPQFCARHRPPFHRVFARISIFAVCERCTTAHGSACTVAGCTRTANRPGASRPPVHRVFARISVFAVCERRTAAHGSACTVAGHVRTVNRPSASRPPFHRVFARLSIFAVCEGCTGAHGSACTVAGRAGTMQAGVLSQTIARAAPALRQSPCCRPGIRRLYAGARHRASSQVPGPAASPLRRSSRGVPPRHPAEDAAVPVSPPPGPDLLPPSWSRLIPPSSASPAHPPTRHRLANPAHPNPQREPQDRSPPPAQCRRTAPASAGVASASAPAPRPSSVGRTQSAAACTPAPPSAPVRRPERMCRRSPRAR
jgi:hypothetical protein